MKTTQLNQKQIAKWDREHTAEGVRLGFIASAISTPLRSLTESHCKTKGCQGETEIGQTRCPECIEKRPVEALEHGAYMMKIGGMAYDGYNARQGR